MTFSVESFKHFVTTDTARLMATYVAIIMAMSLGFSVVLYNTSIQQIEHQRPPQQLYSSDGTILQAPSRFNAFIERRIDESKDQLLTKLVIINSVTLILGSVLSYYLARRSLEPIEAVMDAQMQFVSDASHELRTPLTALRMTNEVALRKKHLTIVDAKTTIAENIEEVDRLKQLTDGLLKLVRDDSLATSPVSLQEVVSSVMTIVAPKAIEKHISLDDRTPAIVIPADKNAFIQIMTILVDNAIKYSPEHTTITISATTTNQNVEIHVKDQGIGIAEKDVSHIFTRFYRADDSRSQTEGYGLGLPIAHKLVSLQHGKLRVESMLGQGSTFTVELPLKS